MKLFSFTFLLLIAGLGLFYTNNASTDTLGEKPKKSFYSFKLNSIEGEPVDFSKFKGKKVLIVNTASKCGFTPQYAELEELHEKYGDKLVILGFPANDFKGQEPGSNEEIAEFCKKNYGVKFQMFEKISVVGEDQHPLYQWLSKKEMNGWNNEAPKWNFSKYLINEKGELVKFFDSKVKPMSKEMMDAINS
jgi:glutathione peroxidase